MSKEEVAKRVEQSLDLFEQGELIDMEVFGEDVRSLITQAAANKAAEEGGLPASDYHGILDEVLSPYGMQLYLNGDPIEMYAANLREIIDLARSDAADRASSKVANKAEVEPTCVCGSPTTLGSVHRTDGPCYVAEATPPATTGASTAHDQALEEAAVVCDKKYEARAASGHPREASAARSCASEIRALKGSVGASTVLTDERTAVLIEARDAVSEMRNHLETFGQYGEETARVALDGAIDTIDELIGEVAAQTGQVAVPEALAILSDLTRPYGVFDVALNNCHKDNVEDFYALLARVRALTPSPAKESK